MCDMLTDSYRMDVEAALVSGAMPADAHSILLSTGYQKRHADMNVGAAKIGRASCRERVF